MGVGHQTVGAQRKDDDLAGKVLLDIALKRFTANIELAALLGIDVAVWEYAVKGVHGAQGHGVTDHQQVVGSIGEAVVILVGVIGCFLVLRFCIFGFLVQDFGALAAQRRGLGHKDQAAQRNDQHDSAGRTGGNVRAYPAGGRGGAIAELGHGTAEGALPKRRLDKAVGAFGHGYHQQYLQNILPPGRVVDVGDRVHKQQQRIMPQVDAVGALANPHKRIGGQGACDQALGLHAGRDNHQREDGAQQRAPAILKRGIAVGERDHGGEADQTHNAQQVDGSRRGPKARECTRRSLAGIGCAAFVFTMLVDVALAVLAGTGQAVEPQMTDKARGRQVAVGDKGHPGAQQQREHAGVGAVVHAAGVGGGVVEHHHGDGGCGGKAQDHAARIGLAHVRGHHGEQQRRPNQIELLLDGERPKMRERRGVAQGVKVRNVLGNLPPIVKEQQ